MAAWPFVGQIRTYPVSITTSTGTLRLHCATCGTTQLLLLSEQAIDRHVPVFLRDHPGHCPSVAPGA